MQRFKKYCFFEGLKSIGESAFNLCKNLSSVELPEGLESIGESAFMAAGFKRC